MLQWTLAASWKVAHSLSSAGCCAAAVLPLLHDPHPASAHKTWTVRLSLLQVTWRLADNSRSFLAHLGAPLAAVLPADVADAAYIVARTDNALCQVLMLPRLSIPV
jgi:hypothetical protein